MPSAPSTRPAPAVWAPWPGRRWWWTGAVSGSCTSATSTAAPAGGGGSVVPSSSCSLSAMRTGARARGRGGGRRHADVVATCGHHGPRDGPATGSRRSRRRPGPWTGHRAVSHPPPSPLRWEVAHRLVDHLPLALLLGTSAGVVLQVDARLLASELAPARHAL